VHVEVRKSGEVVIVDLEGQLVAGLAQQLVRDVVRELLDEGWSRILVNLSAVDGIDSSGIGELVAALKEASRRGASVRLLQARGRVRRTLQISQILPLFAVYDDEAEAVEAFG
jgi:anti-sigma B factor antagonist